MAEQMFFILMDYQEANVIREMNRHSVMKVS